MQSQCTFAILVIINYKSMKDTYTSSVSLVFNASTYDLWDALTNPEKIKQYLFGTIAKSDWKKGSPITYTGEWQGKKYEDKGEILEIIPEKLLKSSYWSSMSGIPDTPENYMIVSYILESVGNQTKLIITQENIASKDDQQHSEHNWNIVLDGIRKVVEHT